MGNKAFDMELFFAALADRTRLRLINLKRLCCPFLGFAVKVEPVGGPPAPAEKHFTPVGGIA